MRIPSHRPQINRPQERPVHVKSNLAGPPSSPDAWITQWWVDRFMWTGLLRRRTGTVANEGVKDGRRVIRFPKGGAMRAADPGCPPGTADFISYSGAAGRMRQAPLWELGGCRR
jgi:hypothetical protein